MRGGRNNDEPLNCSTNNNERALALPVVSDRRSGPRLVSSATTATQTVRDVSIGGPDRQSLVHAALARGPTHPSPTSHEPTATQATPPLRRRRSRPWTCPRNCTAQPAVPRFGQHRTAITPTRRRGGPVAGDVRVRPRSRHEGECYYFCGEDRDPRCLPHGWVPRAACCTTDADK